MIRKNNFNLALVSIACATVLAGCANYEHAKGKAQLRLDKPDDGIESLENAVKLAPTDAEYKIDYLLKRDQTTREILSQADALRADGKLAEAQAAYERVLKMDRGNSRAKAALAALPQDARFVRALTEGEAYLSRGKIDVALDRAMQVLEEHPQNRRALKLKEDARDAQITLDITRERQVSGKVIMEKPITLQFNDAPLRTVFEAISRSVGLNVMLDRDVKPATRVTIFVKDISVADAVDFILMQNQLERRMVNSNTMIVYPSSDAKKAEYEDLTIRSFQVTNADLKYVTGMLKSMLRLKDVTADERTGILIIRDTPERINVAAKLIAVHDVPDPEVMLEVEILELTNGRKSNLGMVPPGSLTVTTPGGLATTWGSLRNQNRDSLLANPLSVTLNFKLEDMDAKLLASPRIRARNKEKAKIMIGDRVPTITNSVTPINTGSAVITGNVSYQDVGLKLEFESQVYANDEVGIKLSLEVSNIAAEFTDPQGGRSYQIGTRNANTNLRLKDGETQILGGLITDQDRNTASKIPGVGHLPVVGRIFGNNDGSDSRSEIVLAITPRIVRNLPAQTPESRNIFSGTSNVLRDRPILAEPISELRTPTAIGAPAGAIGPVGLVPASATGQPNQSPMPPTPAPTPLVQGGALLPPPPTQIVRPPAQAPTKK